MWALFGRSPNTRVCVRVHPTSLFFGNVPSPRSDALSCTLHYTNVIHSDCIQSINSHQQPSTPPLIKIKPFQSCLFGCVPTNNKKNSPHTIWRSDKRADQYRQRERRARRAQSFTFHNWIMQDGSSECWAKWASGERACRVSEMWEHNTSMCETLGKGWTAT